MGIKEDKRDKEKTKRTETGKYFYDLSKASFSITFLGSLASMFKDGTPSISMAIGACLGIGLSAIFSIVGYKILNK